MSLLLLFNSGDFVPPEPDPTPTITPSGGYGIGAYDRTLHKRRKLKKDLEDAERQELADRLEAVLVADGSLKQSEADLLRIKGLVNEYGDDLPNRVRRAALYADRARTEMAIQLALREIARLQEEEMLAVHTALMFDD
jgi:hypothetical protein